MATRDVPQFEGTPTINEAKLNVFKGFLASAIADEDVATDPMDNAFYEGQVSAMRFALEQIYDSVQVPAHHAKA